MNRCIDTGKFDYALTRELPVAIETKKLLEIIIVKEAATAGDFATARAAALDSEQSQP